MKKVLAALALLLAGSMPAYAFGADGHHAVCEIAYRLLTPAAKVKVDLLLQDPSYNTLGKACGWPDHYRDFPILQKYSSDHYINVPRDTTLISECHDKNGNVIDRCLLGAIRRAVYVLENSQTSTLDQIDQGYPPSPVEALRFLGHWYGDIHQPLHVSFADDKGGNDVLVEGVKGCSRNGVTKLHTVWDTCIPKDLMQEAGLSNKRDEFGDHLRAQITANDRATWEVVTDPVQWAQESYEMARFGPTGYCVNTTAGCMYAAGNDHYAKGEPKRTVMTSEAYEDRFGGIVELRMMQAGVRLAKTLNEIFG